MREVTDEDVLQVDEKIYNGRPDVIPAGEHHLPLPSAIPLVSLRSYSEQSSLY